MLRKYKIPIILSVVVAVVILILAFIPLVPAQNVVINFDSSSANTPNNVPVTPSSVRVDSKTYQSIDKASPNHSAFSVSLSSGVHKIIVTESTTPVSPGTQTISINLPSTTVFNYLFGSNIYFARVSGSWIQYTPAPTNIFNGNPTY